VLVIHICQLRSNGLRDEPQSAGGGNCIGFFNAIYRASRPSAAKPEWR